MTTVEINHHLLQRLAFTLGLGLPDSPEAIATAWPLVTDDSIVWSVFDAVALSEEGHDAAFSAAEWADAQLRGARGEQFIPVISRAQGEPVLINHELLALLPTMEFREA